MKAITPLLLIPTFCTFMLFTSPQLMAMENAELYYLVRPKMYIELSSPVDSTLSAMLVKAGDQLVAGVNCIARFDF